MAKASNVTVDGHLSEPAWLAAKPVTTLFETYPRSVAEPTVLTEARFLYDDSYLYIGRSGLVRRDNITID